MIKTKKDLRFYLQEDAKRNGIYSFLKYRIRLLLNCENACIFQYIKCLRYCEYYYNNRKSVYNRFMYSIYKLKLNRLSIKYKISIRLNSCGYGLRIMHIGGGDKNWLFNGW